MDKSEVLAMISKYRDLTIIDVSQVHTYLQPETPILNLDSPAILFMTDFIATHPVVVTENTSILDALELMKRSYVRLLLVSSHNHMFTGIVTASDIHGGKVLAYMAANDIHRREEVVVKNIMTNKDHIHAFQLEQIKGACIGDVINTIKGLGEQHVLIVEESAEELVIRGMYSTTHIAKALQISFDVEPYARSFFELEQVILHHDFHV
jgi:CBS-domain-containing membrane protein